METIRFVKTLYQRDTVAGKRRFLSVFTVHHRAPRPPEMRRRERENVRIALNRADWKIYGPGGAAQLLGVKPTTLVSRIQKMGLRRPTERAKDKA